PDRQAADGALHREVTEARAVVDRGRPEHETHRQTRRGRRDPTAGRGTGGAHPPRLDRAQDEAGDGATDERRNDPVDRAGDELCDQCTEREAEERGEPPQCAPLPCRRHDVTSTEFDAGVEDCEVARRRSWTSITTASEISHTLQRTYPKKFAVSITGSSSGERTP